MWLQRSLRRMYEEYFCSMKMPDEGIWSAITGEVLWRYCRDVASERLGWMQAGKVQKAWAQKREKELKKNLLKLQKNVELWTPKKEVHELKSMLALEAGVPAGIEVMRLQLKERLQEVMVSAMQAWNLEPQLSGMEPGAAVDFLVKDMPQVMQAAAAYVKTLKQKEGEDADVDQFLLNWQEKQLVAA